VSIQSSGSPFARRERRLTLHRRLADVNQALQTSANDHALSFAMQKKGQ